MKFPCAPVKIFQHNRHDSTHNQLFLSQKLTKNSDALIRQCPRSHYLQKISQTHNKKPHKKFNKTAVFRERINNQKIPLLPPQISFQRVLLRMLALMLISIKKI